MDHLYKTLGLEDNASQTKQVQGETYRQNLSELDRGAKASLKAIRSEQEIGVAIEVIANTLTSGKKACGLNKTALRLANLAYSSFTDKTHVSLEELPINVSAYDKDPLVVVEEGVDKITASKEAVFDWIKKELSNLLVINARQREALQFKMKEMRGQWHLLDDALSRGLSPDADRDLLISGRSDNLMLMYGGNIVDSGATVMPDLSHFLTEHSHLFKRLIKKQINWLADHKQNVLRTANGFNSFVFNPAEYQIHGATPVSDKSQFNLSGNLQAYRSSELPGMMAFYSICSGETVVGYDAIKTLTEANTNLATYDPVSYAASKTARFGGSDKETMKGLTREEVQARLAETKRTMDDLEHWGQIAFVELWKDVCFEEEILSVLIKTDAEGINERLLGELALAIINLLNEATANVVGYVTHVIDAMLGFLDYACFER